MYRPRPGRGRRPCRLAAAAVSGAALLGAAVPGDPVGAGTRRATAPPAEGARVEGAGVGDVAARGATDPAVRIAALTAAARRAAAALAAATAREERARRDLAAAEEQLARAEARTDTLGRQAEEASRRAVRTRRQLEAVAVAAYREGAGGSALARLFSSGSVTEVSYRREIVARVAAERRAVIRRSVAAFAAAREAEAAARAARDALRAQVGGLRQDVVRTGAARAAAQETAGRVGLWRSRWEAVAAGAATSILGAPALGAEEMAAWFRASGRRSRATVPIEELAAFYVEESAAAFVRGDIAFAQSILETGGFRFPEGGLVRPEDNNFAGIGACDSCARGRSYPDARTGVRAQMQLLRVYADANLRNGDLHPPAVDPRLDRHFLRGRVTTWAGLSGTWATAAGYGERILAIYTEMLAWLTDRARL